jgi:signal transduction histidine kinase
VNAHGLIQMANPAAEAALGLGALGFHRYSDVLGAGSPLTRLLASCLQEGRTFQREEVEHRTAKGEIRHLGVTISPTAPPHTPGAPAKPRAGGALCLLSDLTELTALQKQVRLQENMAALGEMSAGIAHEFKNALATISGYAQMIRDEAGTGETAESAERILKETRALTHVVTEFLRFARPLELSRETVALEPLVDQVARETRETVAGATIRKEGAFAEVQGDDGLLRQALLNLARNAAEAATAHSSSAEVILRGAVENGWQRVAVADNGPGIPPDSLDKVFLPFFTTKTNGTGLGLAVVQKIALQHGGRVEATNRTGGGAEFILWLPLPAAEAQAVESPPRSI